MAETTTLTDHQAIREWAIARAGKPMMHYVPDGAGGETPVLSLTFGQRSIIDGDQNPSLEGRKLVEWRDWLATLDEQGLALAVPAAQMGTVDQSHQIIKR